MLEIDLLYIAKSLMWIAFVGVSWYTALSMSEGAEHTRHVQYVVERGEISLNASLAAAILLVSLGLLGFVAWDSYRAQARADCQSGLNREFQETLVNNTEANAQDRDNLDATIEALIEADSREDSSQILEDYLQQRREADDARQDYPPIPSRVC